jgi:hypothetical protein
LGRVGRRGEGAGAGRVPLAAPGPTRPASTPRARPGGGHTGGCGRRRPPVSALGDLCRLLGGGWRRAHHNVSPEGQLGDDGPGPSPDIPSPDPSDLVTEGTKIHGAEAVGAFAAPVRQAIDLKNQAQSRDEEVDPVVAARQAPLRMGIDLREPISEQSPESALGRRPGLVAAVRHLRLPRNGTPSGPPLGGGGSAGHPAVPNCGAPACLTGNEVEVPAVAALVHARRYRRRRPSA